MGRNAAARSMEVRYSRTGVLEHGGRAMDGLAGAAVALIGAALLLAALAHGAEMTMGTEVRAAVIAAAVVLGAVAGAAPWRATASAASPRLATANRQR